MNAIAKKTAKLAVELGKVIVIEGIISVATQGLRDVSKTNYKTAKENSRQIANLTRNAINGRVSKDWGLDLED